MSVAIVAKPNTELLPGADTVMVLFPVLMMVIWIVVPTLARGTAFSKVSEAGNANARAELVGYVKIPPRHSAAVGVVVATAALVNGRMRPWMLPLAWIEPDVELDP